MEDANAANDDGPPLAEEPRTDADDAEEEPRAASDDESRADADAGEPRADADDDAVAKCRFCLDPADAARLIAPCECAGSAQFVHDYCLARLPRRRRGHLRDGGGTMRWAGRRGQCV